jgi:hypothetical protein
VLIRFLNDVVLDVNVLRPLMKLGVLNEPNGCLIVIVHHSRFGLRISKVIEELAHPADLWGALLRGIVLDFYGIAAAGWLLL